MLAHSGLALITEKLQNQRLEESSTSASGCKHLVAQDNPTKLAYPQRSNLAVKGKNVWAVSLESEPHGWHGFGSQDVSKPSPRPADKVQVPHILLCRHKKLSQSCLLCGGAPGSPMAPPKKKHCRSLSVPPDSLTVLPALVKDQGDKIWKPIAMIPRCSSNLQDCRDVNQRSGIHSEESTKWLPKLSSGFKLIPAPPSSPSADSGHYTTSDFQTPSGSPVPRPSSVSSDTSFSSRGSAWREYSPTRAQGKVLENRSLSYEDRISGSFSATCGPKSLEQTSRCRSSNSQDASSSSSAIPRCHSQPCVLHHRRCGKKRRRDCDRPTLNFIKMTETAYTQRFGPRNTGVSQQQHSVPRPHVFSENTTSSWFGLNTIASSPLDAEFPVIPQRFLYPDLSQAASVALPPTPPGQNSPDFPPFVACRTQGEEDEEEEDEGCNCHDGRTRDGVGLFPMNDLDIEQIESH